jgi:hypothetical protein
VYDPVYGLPIIQEVAKYGEVLRDMREGRVKEILWFANPKSDNSKALDFEGRYMSFLLEPFETSCPCSQS